MPTEVPNTPKLGAYNGHLFEVSPWAGQYDARCFGALPCKGGYFMQDRLRVSMLWHICRRTLFVQNKAALSSAGIRHAAVAGSRTESQASTLLSTYLALTVNVGRQFCIGGRIR